MARTSYQVDTRPLPFLVARELAGEVWRGASQGRRRMELFIGAYERGFCPICDQPTLFIERSEWLRDGFVCLRCRSIPRWRTLAVVLEELFPLWRTQKIHESSPGGALSDRLQRSCPGYVSTHYYPKARPGEIVDGFRSENLE